MNEALLRVRSVEACHARSHVCAGVSCECGCHSAAVPWGDVEVLEGRTCRRCKTWKPLGKFGQRNGKRNRTCSNCYYVASPLVSLGLIARARGIVITDIGRQTLREMEAGSHA